MRKKRLIFAAIIALPGLLAPLLRAALPAIQFYKPNRAASLVVALKNKDRYSSRDPVVVTVMLTNQSQKPQLVNSRMLFNQYPLEGEVAFVIEGPKATPYPLTKAVSPHDIRDSDLVVLHVGETMERTADLTDMYRLRKHGTYKLQVIYYNRVDLEKDGLRTWRGSVASEPSEITIQ